MVFVNILTKSENYSILILVRVKINMFEGKKIFILGMARSGYAAAKLLATMDNEITINDQSKQQDENHVVELKRLGVNVVLGEHPDDLFTEEYDYLIKNPGIVDNHQYILTAQKNKIPIINELELAYHLFPQGVDIIGVTGTNGKTTTTTLIYEMLKKTKRRVHLMGNIGYPSSSFVGKVEPLDIIVMEVSVQQLCNIKDFKTTVSVLLNLYEAHLDITNTYENYISIKKKIFNNHRENDYAVLNLDNPDVVALSEGIKTTKTYFSSKETNVDCFINNGVIYYKKEKIVTLEEIKLKGAHNCENIMAAILTVKRFGLSNDIIKKVLEHFTGVEHRLEYVKRLNGREIYNDSKSTNIKATQTALQALNKPLILILGGLDRKESFEGLKGHLCNVKSIVSYGETKERIKIFAEALKIKCTISDNLKEAVGKAYKLSVSGDIILLSPACASWDQFKDFEERGRKFKKYIEEL